MDRDATPPGERGEEGDGLLIVDDDAAFRDRLAQAMERRGFRAQIAGSLAEGAAAAEAGPPPYAVVDLRLGDGNGLELVEVLRARRPDIKVIVLTGYGNIATAVAAVKSGAVDYLAKPSDADEIAAALRATGPAAAPTPSERPMSVDRLRWEHVQRIYEQCDRNMSETARRLNMHRRTLQRMFSKYSPR